MFEITTPRLLIRPLRIEEAAAINNLITEKISMWTAPIPWPHNLEHAEWWINNSPEEKRLGIYRDGTLIGTTSMPSTDGEEVGFWINEKYEGHGYATEAAAAIIDYSFSIKNLKLLDSFVHRDNLGSRRVHEKLGFKLIGETENFWRNRNANVPVVHFRLEKLI
jgi:[ribosomal protein S5]-alanine N-acetyltransferase